MIVSRLFVRFIAASSTRDRTASANVTASRFSAREIRTYPFVLRLQGCNYAFWTVLTEHLLPSHRLATGRL